MFLSYLPLSEYKQDYYNTLNFNSFLSVFFQGIFSDLLTPSFFRRLLSLKIPMSCLFLIINVWSGLGITEYLLYPWIKTYQLITIASSFIALYQNTNIQFNKILFTLLLPMVIKLRYCKPLMVLFLFHLYLSVCLSVCLSI